VLHGQITFAGGCELTKRLLDENSGITSIFAGNDVMACGAVRAILDRGLSVPGDISLIGFDNIELSSVIHPPRTTIHQPKWEIGRSNRSHPLGASFCKRELL
jgi:DNA-binding LacI/PurR family transcriptional regulator